MKKPFLMFLAWLLLSPISSQADVQLSLPANVRVVASNGQNNNGQNSLTLPDGKNQIALRFEGELGRGKDAEYVYSEAIVATFEARNADLRLNIPEIRSSNTLNSFNKNPQIELTDATGRSVSCQTAVLKKEGFQIQRDYAQELAEFNTSGAPAAIPAVSIPAQPAASDPAIAGQMLQYWYQQADATTRTEFKRWLEKH